MTAGWKFYIQTTIVYILDINVWYFYTLHYTLELYHLVWFLGLGGGDDPHQGLLPVVAVGAVHEELVPGAADALPLRVAPPGGGGLARGGGVAGGGVPVGHHLAAAGLDLLHQGVRAHARADVPETVSHECSIPFVNIGHYSSSQPGKISMDSAVHAC